MRRLAEVLIVAAGVAAAFVAIEARGESFEVATIRQNTSGSQLAGLQRQPGGRLTVTNMSVRTLITFAYLINGYQIAGGPGWLDSDRFDIIAKIDGEPGIIMPGSLMPDRTQLAMRTLLADRFKLKLHKEQRPMDVFALVVSKPGAPGLKPSTSDCDALAEQARQGKATPPHGTTCSILGSPGRISFDGFGMAQVANMLNTQAGRMVVDRTNLAGKWQFVLTFAPEGATDSNAPSFFTALHEQIGLKLEPAKLPVEVTVIDAAEHPTED